MELRKLPLVVALAALSTTVALAFGRVFATNRYVAPLVAAALLPHAIGLVARWRGARDVIVWASSLGGLLVYAVFLLPGGGAPGAFFDRLRDGWQAVQQDAVPLRPGNGVILLAALVVWLVSALADDLAIERSASLGAIAPGVTVLIWVMALGTEDSQWLSVVLFGAAATFFLAVAHQVLLEQRRTRIGPRRVVEAPGLLVSGALIGVVAIVLGVAAGPALPGGDEPLFEAGGAGDRSDDSYRTEVAPFLDVSDKLQRSRREHLLTVRAERGQYWRLLALDEYEGAGGGRWTLRAQGDENVADGLDASVPEGALEQEVRISDLGERWLPAAYEPVDIDLDDVLVVRSSSTLVFKGNDVAGLSYRVVSAPPSEQLTPAQIAATEGSFPEELARFTELPADFPVELRDLAERTTAGATNAHDRALALRDFFRAPGAFVYDPSADFRDTGQALVDFVLNTRRGFCVQFASAFTTMARAVDIPARVAVGFTAGREVTPGVFEVTNLDAHAWPEVYLAGVGWVHAFDPTPPIGETGGRGGSNLQNEIPPPPGSATAPTTTVPTLAPSTTLVPSPSQAPQPSPTQAGGGVTVDRSDSEPDADRSGLEWIALVVLAVVAVVAAPVLLIVWLKARRRARRRDDPDVATAVSGAWAEAVDHLTDRRIVWPPSDTPRELAERVPELVGAGARAPMRALADSYSAVRYGEVAPPATAADAAWRQVDELRRALDASSTIRTRVRARLDPGTLRRRDRSRLEGRAPTRDEVRDER